MQADSDALRRSAGSQPMGLPIGYGFTHDFALCRSAGAVRYFHRLRHAFSVQMVWFLSLTYGQAHRLSSGTPSACLFYTQKIRNRAAHTLFDSFATALSAPPCGLVRCISFLSGQNETFTSPESFSGLGMSLIPTGSPDQSKFSHLLNIRGSVGSPSGFRSVIRTLPDEV